MNILKGKVSSSSIIIYAWGLVMVICLYFFIRSNIHAKESTRIVEMLGKDSSIESISVIGTYITDDVGNTSDKVISMIADKDDIERLTLEINKYEFKYIDNTKLPEVKRLRDEGALQSLTFNFTVKNAKYNGISATIYCCLPEGYVYADVVKTLKRRGYKTIYGGTNIDENLIKYLETNYSK
jgi:hypothetical protein